MAEVIGQELIKSGLPIRLAFIFLSDVHYYDRTNFTYFSQKQAYEPTGTNMLNITSVARDIKSAPTKSLCV